MTGELADAPDMHGALGWIYAQEPSHSELARASFHAAHRLGTRKVDPYFHWTEMERRIAEQKVGGIPDRELLDLWQRATEVTEKGLGRCGDVDTLCSLSGYLKRREARTHERLNEFAPAQGAPASRYQIYRGLSLAYAGLSDAEGLVRSINNWKSVARRDDPTFVEEVYRAIGKFRGIEQRFPWIHESSGL